MIIFMSKFENFCKLPNVHPQFAMMFADSMMRPFVQHAVSLDDMSYRLGCHCSAGGTLRSVCREMAAFEMKEDPAVIVVSVGTNNLGNKHSPGRITRYAHYFF